MNEEGSFNLLFYRLHPDGTEYAEISAGTTTLDSPSITQGGPTIMHLGGRLNTRLLLTNNPNGMVIGGLRIRVEVQTNAQRTILFDSDPHQDVSMPPATMLPIDFVHDVRELGIHLFIISIHYLQSPPTAATSPADIPPASPFPSRAIEGNKLFMRKFFKFTSMNPLILKTKVTNILSHDLLFLEAQLQNAAEMAFTINDVSFEPADCFVNPRLLSGDEALLCSESNSLLSSLTDLRLNATDEPQDSPGPVAADGGCPSGTSPPKSPKGNKNHSRLKLRSQLQLKRDEIYQFAFILNYFNIINFREPVNLGRLDISWISDDGEEGRLQTSPLSHQEDSVSMATDPSILLSATHEAGDDFVVSLRDLPVDGVKLGHVFDVLFLFRNCTNFDIENLTLNWSGVEFNQNKWDKSVSMSSLVIPETIMIGVHTIHLGVMTVGNTTRCRAQFYSTVPPNGSSDETKPYVLIDNIQVTYQIGGAERIKHYNFAIRINKT